MKTLFEKFKVSNALDQGGESSADCEMGEAGRFEQSLSLIDCDLRASRAGNDVPPNLHATVMRAVRVAGVEEEPVQAVVLWRRLAAVGLVLVVGAAALWLVNRPSVNEAGGMSSTMPSASFTTALQQGHELTQAAPGTVLGPLSGELDLLNRDVQNALNFVAASVP